jgi:hypothetical protein
LAALRTGWDGAELDLAGALAAAQAHECAPAAAVTLLAALGAGVERARQELRRIDIGE